jgi:hypothetical protein
MGWFFTCFQLNCACMMWEAVLTIINRYVDRVYAMRCDDVADCNRQLVAASRVGNVAGCVSALSAGANINGHCCPPPAEGKVTGSDGSDDTDADPAGVTPAAPTSTATADADAPADVGADADTAVGFTSGSTALTAAVQGNHLAVVEFLLLNGADVNLVDGAKLRASGDVPFLLFAPSFPVRRRCPRTSSPLFGARVPACLCLVPAFQLASVWCATPKTSPSADSRPSA